MALEEIAVADIRKGQKIRWEPGNGYWHIDGIFAQEYVAIKDGHGMYGTPVKYYLIEDVPQPPPFEVPWGTVQRDKEGDLWEFAEKAGDEEGEEGVVAAVAGAQMFTADIAEYAPFTRLYTVQELIELLQPMVADDDDADCLVNQLEYFKHKGII